MHRVSKLVGHLTQNHVEAAANANGTAARVFGDKSQFTIRPLEITDYDKGIIPLLGQLTTVGEVSKAKFEETFRAMQATGGSVYNTLVVEDTTKGVMIGCATLLLELKFIHECGKVGHIEDVVVNSAYRGNQLGAILIKALKEIGLSLGCYKIILDCDRKNVQFYEKLGFMEHGIECAFYANK